MLTCTKGIKFEDQISMSVSPKMLICACGSGVTGKRDIIEITSIVFRPIVHAMFWLGSGAVSGTALTPDLGR